MKRSLIVLILVVLVQYPLFVKSQTKPIRGIVYSKDNQKPLEGVSVLLVQTNEVSITDSTGRFEMIIPNSTPEKHTLSVSSVGYQTQSIEIDTEGLNLIYLETNARELEEVIISTGYQSVPKERATGSFVSIDHDLLNRQASSDIISRLENVTSGLFLDRRDKGRPSLSIRGQSTVMSETAPLIVVDNFPYEGDITNINPDDVEHVTVLKDAASASIWGARASNGVIVITTKRGQRSKPMDISITSNIIIENAPDFKYNRNFLNASDFIDVERTLFKQDYYDWKEADYSYPVITPAVDLMFQNRNGLLSDGALAKRLDYLGSVDVRDQIAKYLYRKVVNQQHSMNMKGGSEKADYYLSLGHNAIRQEVVNHRTSRTTFNGALNFSLSDAIQAGSSFGYSRNHSLSSNSGFETYGLYPYAELVDAQGTPLAIPRGYNNQLKESASSEGLLDWYYRPIDELNSGRYMTQRNDVRLNTFLSYHPFRQVKIEGRYQFQNQDINVDNVFKEKAYYVRDLVNRYAQKENDRMEFPIPIGAIVDRSHSSILSHSGRLQLGFLENWKDIRVNAIAGAEIRQMGNVGNSARAYGFDEEIISSRYVDYTEDYVTRPTFSSLKIPYRTDFFDFLDRNISYYANTAVEYKNRYILSGSIRKDQSNLFGLRHNQKGVPLWSLGGSWQISADPQYTWQDWLPYLRVRTTFGYNGNINKTLTAYPTARYSTNRTTGFLQGLIFTPPNPELRWERVSVFNVGVDFRLFNNLLSGSFEYYQKRGDDLIGVRPLDPTIGFSLANRSSFTGNNSDMKSRGIDIQLNLRKMIARKIEWQSHILSSFIKDEITRYDYEGTLSSYLGSYSTARVGFPRQSIYSYRWAGLSDRGEPQIYLPDGQRSFDYPSILASNDIDIIDYSGPVLPTHFGSFRNSFTYDRLTFGINITYKLGYFFRNSSISYSGLFESNSGHVDFTNRWKKPGDERVTDVPSFPEDVSLAAVRDAVYLNSSHLVEKGDHIRLQDIRFSYSLSLGKRLTYFRNLNVHANLNNIGILWSANKLGVDPDFALQDFPNPLSFSIGVTLN